MQILGHEISPIQVGGIAVLGYLIVTQGSGNLAAHQRQANIIASARQESQLEAAKLQVSEQERKAREAIAAARYKAGCQMVFAKGTRTLTALTEGQPVLDPSRSTPLPAGTIVCDSVGNTGKIIANAKGEPVVGEMAFASDRTLIHEAMARYGGAQYRGSVN